MGAFVYDPDLPNWQHCTVRKYHSD